jgi:hypothetical protein
MVSQGSPKIVDQAEALYEQHLKTTLEGSQPGAFVAIEPVSGDHLSYVRFWTRPTRCC